MHSVLLSQSRRIQSIYHGLLMEDNYVFVLTSSSNSQHLYSIKFIVAQGKSLKSMKTRPFNEEMCVKQNRHDRVGFSSHS